MGLNKRQLQVVNAEDDAILCMAGAGSGKALPNSVRIPTPQGWKAVNEIKIGDYLFDRMGRPTKVLGVYPQGKREVYQLTFEDGRTAKSSIDHIWAVYLSKDASNFENKTLEEILAINSEIYIPTAAPVQYENSILNPYTAGREAEEKGIPEGFKYVNEIERRMVVQGMMDKRGLVSYEGNSYTPFITTKSQKLAKDFIEIVESLGYGCKYSNLDIENQSTYFIYIIMPEEEIKSLFYDRKKFDAVCQIKKTGNGRLKDRIKISKIEDLGYEEKMTCFLVDNEEHLFLTEHFICTHNTHTLVERIRHLIKDCNVDTKEIVAITFTNLAANEMKKRLEDVRGDMYIGTIHSYANRICIMNGLDTTDLIKTEQYDELLRMASDGCITKYPRIRHLLVDEAQDMSGLEMYFINSLPTDNIFLIGDDRQNIFQFRGCSDKYMRNLYNNNNFAKYYLNKDYRNAPNIIKYANSLLGSYEALSQDSVAIKNGSGYVDEQATFEEVIQEIKENKNWNSWFVLTRTNMELDKAFDLLEDAGVPCISFKKSDVDSLEEFDELMNSNKVKVLTMHASKGLERRNVVVIGARLFNITEQKLAYVAATRAEDTLYVCPSIISRGEKYYSPNKRIKGERLIVF